MTIRIKRIFKVRRFLTVLYFLFISVLSSQTFAVSPPMASDLPWLTGPLLTPSARVVPMGHVNVETYAFYRTTNGVYDKNWKAKKRPNFYHTTAQINLKGGIYERINLSCIIQGHYNCTKHASSAGFGDLPIGLEFQVIEDNKENIPVKIGILEIFPTGKYQHLSSKKNGTDATGTGSFITVFGLTISKLFHLQKEHYLNARFNILGVLPSQVRVKGYNHYGGDRHSHGKVLPGKSLFIRSAIEYTLNRNWVLATDLICEFTEKKHIKGFVANTRNRIQFGASPAIEYNFTKEVGIIVGAWFTFAGKNSDRFISLVGAVNCYF